ncbi:amidohydrolase family protein [Marinomonas sp. IMCC 4694]|uniref:amidohydrolase family protein n=1 Tax=Marinomonas sp. IMCC 4694 TaxID=2605432 RepID=UPI0011E882F4|nr:amidohydrolase family protein [Marinomonas sp. IMCC 4694]TYL47350.1 amidohydrolase family protein [Marinomonas sp. IMCC 4694]
MRRCFSVALLALLSVSGCAFSDDASEHRTLASFSSESNGESACYDRENEPYTAVVDTHLHYRPFDGRAIPFNEMNEYLSRTTVRFANVYGIGQMLPAESACSNYLKCPGTPVSPTTRNDFVNAANLVEHKPEGLHLTLSMTFTDLSNPEPTLALMEFYDKEYSGLFHWMGEVNLVKQAQFNNRHKAATPQNISQWSAFMAELRARDYPITIHSDLGNNASPTLYLPLMENALALYPDNKIVWAHMGMSHELTNMDASQHIAIMSRLLEQYPNLMIDISWRILDDYYFSKWGNQDKYVAFMNRYSERILPGSDFVAFRGNNFKVYQQELNVTSRIHQFLSDDAFRNIALGENYFKLLNLDYQAPTICP